jgi:hypothetical protein
MTMEKDVLGIVPGVMSLGVLGESMKMLPGGMTGGKGKKGNGFGKPMNYKKQNGNMIKGFGNIMVGTALIGATSSMINKM